MAKGDLSAEMKKQIEELVDSHMKMKGSGYGSELDGGAYGVFLEKKKQGGNLDRQIGSGLDREVGSALPCSCSEAHPEVTGGNQEVEPKKRGRPAKPKKHRTFNPESRTAKRALKVKELMNSLNISLIDASKKIHDEKIPY